jgi:F-type H+-transporting ATPase subunit a
VNLTPDQHILWQLGFFKLNTTIVTTWVLMLTMALLARLLTRGLSNEGPVSQRQAALEIIVTALNGQIRDVGLAQPGRYLAFLGTLFLFIAVASLGTIVPGYQPPTSSLSTTAALALSVLFAVPYFGIRERGFGGYLRTYTEPTAIMLPFNIISELSRTLALAVRLFGNMMSGAMIVGILLTITPLLFPIVMTALGLLTGMVQAYIFGVLATVYIAAATIASRPGSRSAQRSPPATKVPSTHPE